MYVCVVDWLNSNNKYLRQSTNLKFLTLLKETNNIIDSIAASNSSIQNAHIIHTRPVMNRKKRRKPGMKPSNFIVARAASFDDSFDLKPVDESLINQIFDDEHGFLKPRAETNVNAKSDAGSGMEAGLAADAMNIHANFMAKAKEKRERREKEELAKKEAEEKKALESPLEAKDVQVVVGEGTKDVKEATGGGCCIIC